jgi:hypothetical protein
MIRSHWTLALLLLAPAALGAQEGTKPKPEAVKPKEAQVTLPARELSVPVAGLTAENASALRDELKALTMQAYTCAPCKVEQAKEGACPKCKAALKAETRAYFTLVQPAPDQERLALTLDPRVSLPLSRLERLLAEHDLEIGELALPGSLELLVRAPQSIDAAALKLTLEDAKLFEAVEVRADPAANQWLVSARSGKKPPTRAQLTTALAGPKAQLVDVIFVPVVPRS